MQIVVFKLGKEEYAFDIQSIQEIVRLQNITEVPNMPLFVEGIINLRGKIIPVLNLAKKFNLPSREESDSIRLIVLNIDEGQQIAVKADEVTEVKLIEETSLDELQNENVNNKEHCLKGVIKMDKRLIILLDSNKLINSEEIFQTT